MKRLIKFVVNGFEKEIAVEPWWSLAHVLREELDLTGTKVSCNEGDCGACTVLIDGKAVKSCIYPAIKARGKDIVTIEGLSGKNGKLHKVQESFIENFAIQCGYCTPGMIMTTKALLDDNPNPDEEEVREYLQGNLCRCTGYKKIVEAVLYSAQK
jgi:carbon-monoxide dehydrogenase small subunit